MAHFNLDLDLDKSQAVGQVVRARVGDVESCVIAATIYDHGSEVDLSGMGARFCMLKPDRTVIEDDGCEVSGSTVTHTLGTQATAAAGVAKLAYFEILDGSTVIDSTQSFRLVVEPDAEGAGSGPSEDYISRVDAATEAANEAAEAATGAAQSATTAAGAAETAADAANDAAGAANEAAQRADAAAEIFPEGGESGQLLSKTADGTAWVDPPSGNVLTGEAEGYVAHAEDAYAQKPREVRVKGKTWVNRWPYNGNYEYDGVVVTMDETGLVQISGTVTKDVYVTVGLAVGVAPSKPYMLMVSSLPLGVAVLADSYSSENTWLSSIVVSNGTHATGTTPADMAELRCMFLIKQGITVNASLRVMLVDGTEAPDCFTPCASITSAQPENLVTAGKNLAPKSTPQTSETTKKGLSATVNPDGSYHITGTSTEAYATPITAVKIFLNPGTYTLRGRLASKNSKGYIYAQLKINNGYTTANNGPTLIEVERAKLYEISFTADKQGSTFDGDLYVQLELGSTATAYEPPNITTTALPEVELRSLPDGTCDELVIRSDGTCEVERRLAQKTIDAEHPINVGILVPASGTDLPYVTVASLFPSFDSSSSPIVKLMYSTSWPYTENLKSRGVYRAWNSTIFVDERFTDKETARSIINEAGGTFVAQVPSSTEPQSPVTLPALPAPTFNQYHDSPVPSDTSTEYARDMNIAFDQLAKQIAGTVSAVAVREASTIEEE